MANCPCCGEPLPASVGPDVLCSACTAALDDPVDADHRVVAPDAPSPIHRPVGVTLLAIVYYFLASAFLFVAVVYFPSVDLHFSEGMDANWHVLFLLFVALVFWVFGRALWGLQHWMRVLAMAFSVLGLVAGSQPSDWWLRALYLAQLLYLASPGVKVAFDAASGQEKPLIVDKVFSSKRSRAKVVG